MKTNCEAFFKTIIQMKHSFFNISFLILFYAILGMQLFRGLKENRCRYTNAPVNETWIADPNLKFLCGYRSCPKK